MAMSESYGIRPNPSLQSAMAVRSCPISAFERLCIAENYPYERLNATDMHIRMPGLWCDHEISICWMPQKELLKLHLAFSGRTLGGRSDDMCRLLSLINERLNVGHFDYWQKHGTLVYRDSMSLCGGASVKMEQVMSMLASALDAAERGYPACQYVMWAGQSPEEALNSALVDIAGSL